MNFSCFSNVYQTSRSDFRIKIIYQLLMRKEEREAFLAELDQRLDKREKLIGQVDRTSLNEAEQKLGAELIKLNKRLMNRLEQLKQGIRFFKG